MVKPVRESRLATIPTVREALPPWAAVSVVIIGRCSVAGVEHAAGDAKVRLVAWQRLVEPALVSQTQHSRLDHGSRAMLVVRQAGRRQCTIPPGPLAPMIYT